MDLIDSPEVTKVDKTIEAWNHELRKKLLLYKLGVAGLSLIPISFITLIAYGLITKDWNVGSFAIIVAIFGGPFTPLAFMKLSEMRDELLSVRQNIVDLRQLRREKIAQISNTPRTKYLRYKDSLQDLVARYRSLSARYRQLHNVLQLTTIIGSAVTSTLIAAAGDLPWARWVGASIALLLGISAGVSSYFKMNDKSSALQKAADSIEAEIRAFDLQISDYENLRDEAAIMHFVQKVEIIREEQANRMRDLDQPSDQITFTNSQTM